MLTVDLVIVSGSLGRGGGRGYRGGIVVCTLGANQMFLAGILW